MSYKNAIVGVIVALVIAIGYMVVTYFIKYRSEMIFTDEVMKIYTECNDKEKTKGILHFDSEIAKLNIKTKLKYFVNLNNEGEVEYIYAYDDNYLYENSGSKNIANSLNNKAKLSKDIKESSSFADFKGDNEFKFKLLSDSYKNNIVDFVTINTPIVLNETTKEETKTETPKSETPKTENPKSETPKTETPKTEDPKKEGTTTTNEKLTYSLDTKGFSCNVPADSFTKQNKPNNIGEYQNGKYVYCIVMGRFPTGGYSVTVEKVEINGNNATISVKYKYPKPGDTVTQAFTTPTAMVIFNKKPDSIKLNETTVNNTTTTKEEPKKEEPKTSTTSKNIGYSLNSEGYTCPISDKDINKFNTAGNIGEYQNGKYVYCIVMGRFPTGGYSIDIKKVEVTGKDVKIVAKYNYPSPSDTVTQAFTTPKAIVVFDEKPDNIEIVQENMYNLMNVKDKLAVVNKSTKKCATETQAFSSNIGETTYDVNISLGSKYKNYELEILEVNINDNDEAEIIVEESTTKKNKKVYNEDAITYENHGETNSRYTVSVNNTMSGNYGCAFLSFNKIPKKISVINTVKKAMNDDNWNYPGENPVLKK